MKARSSSYSSHLGRATGHVRRTSRTAAEFGQILQSAASGLRDDPAWLDFSPQPDRQVGPGSARYPGSAGKRSRYLPPPPPRLRPNKSAQRLLADARVAVKTRARGLDRRILVGAVGLFFPVFFVLYFSLQRLYGLRVGSPPAGTIPASNAKRVRGGLPPLEFWPFRARTRLRHLTAIPRRAGLEDVLAARTRAVPPARDYRRVGRPGGAPLTPVRVSLLAACRDRTGFLQTALPGWLAALSPVDELVLVDWGTDPAQHVPLMAVAEAAADPRIALVTVRNASAWALSHAYNLALSHARGEWVLKLDCDVTLARQFLQLHALPPAPRPTAAATPPSSTSAASTAKTAIRDQKPAPRPWYYSFHVPGDAPLAGVLLARTSDVRSVGGYDERVATYGAEAADLRARLEKRGLSRRALIPTSAEHIDHSAAFAAGDQKLVAGPALERELNRLALARVPAWDARHTTAPYTHALAANDGGYSFATASTTLAPLHARLPPPAAAATLAAAQDALLHDRYGVPHDVLSETGGSRAELVMALDAAQRGGAWKRGAGVLFATLSGTAAERLLGAASAAALALEFQRPLFLAWARGVGAGGRGSARAGDVFDLEQAAAAGLHVLPVGRWRCPRAASCAPSDTAYSGLFEHSAGAPAAPVLEALRAAPYRNVLLHLAGSFPGLPRAWTAAGLRALPPAPAVAAALSKAGDLRTARGVFVGPGMRPRAVDAMAGRLSAHAADGRPYYVAGADRSLVARAASRLGARRADPNAAEHVQHVADLFALARCRDVVNDGRPAQDALDAAALLKDALRHL